MARSTTLFFATELSPLATVTARIDVEAGVRVHHRGLALMARGGAGLAWSSVTGSPLYGLHAGAGAGWSFRLGERLVLTPMADYDLFSYWQLGGPSALLVHRLTACVPVAWVVSERVVVEAFFAAGVAFVDGTQDLAVSAGPRIGLVF